ncbi:PQQ-dependent sugar dehydrogenase [Povalibacter sp.]|uniref:PQQ-dependent sugar dehydrogenase n=1 Tax=Povalibacter sp. TaxID=1962978 RepID=UPI002F4168B8
MLTATVAGSTRIDLSWTAATDSGGSGLSGYRIYRDGVTTAIATVTAPGTTYADTTLSASTQYSYVVRAFDGAGNESGASTAASATTQAPSAPGTAGLDSRPANSTCVAWEKPANGSIQVQPFTSLSFDASVALLQAPNDNGNWYVVEQGGTIKRFSGTNPASASTYGTVTVTSGGEMGLLGMAFHPDFPTDSRVFLSYTIRVSNRLESRISSFANSSTTALGGTETILLRVTQPEDNHNGGDIHFGPDGFLYIGFGDGGGAGDNHGSTGNGQRLTTLLGKMLRIDVNSATPYGIPAGNPFASQALCPADGRSSGECPEIYAWGLRNPWRWSFDRATGELWVGDVGQGQWEEVNRISRAGNYGWRCREGAHGYDPDTPGCSTAALIDPETEYDHSLGTAITGGYVYRGTQSTPLKGRYLFGDSGTGRIWAWLPENATAQAPRQPTQLADTTLSIVSFGEGNDGEMYVVNYNSLHRLVFQAPTGGGTVPASLSATGCVTPADPKQPASGLIPYAINAPFWSDGAAKDRWIGLPDGQNITVQASGDWDFPNGTVLMKNFTLASRLIETRLFMRHPDGSWGGYTYAWNDAQTDATLVQGGSVRAMNGQQWIYPSEGQCVQCHTNAAGGSLGLETAQLNRDLLYPQTGRTANELFTLNHIQTLTPAIPDPAAQPKMPDPSDTSASLNDRARAYLHTNCAQCHRTGGPTPSTLDLRYTTPLNQTNACEAAPQAGDLGIGTNARLIDPGSATNSIVVNRTNRRDANAMPPVGSNQIDTAGVALLTQWINGLTGC